MAKYIFPGVRNNSSLENLFPVSTSIQKLKVMITLASVLDLGLTRKVVLNYLRNILENFGNFWTTIPVDIYFSSCIQNLFISRNRDLERKSFDHLNHQIGLCVDYQSCSTWIYLAPTKISRQLNMQSSGYTFFRIKRFSVYTVPSSYWNKTALYLPH